MPETDRKSEQVGALFRLDTQFGGGKTHGLIALAHTVRSGKSLASTSLSKPA
jgi:predicted AAA+ superfamily ATPase